MTAEVAGLLGANALALAVGAGLLRLLGAVPTRAALVRRLGLCYFAGLALVGIAAANLALVGVPFGLPALAVLAGACLLAGLRARRRGCPRAIPALPPPGQLALTVARFCQLVILGLLVRAGVTFAHAPLGAWDAWANWAVKARALTVLGWADPAFFAAPGLHVNHPRYPLLVPSLEALDFHAMGTQDTRLVHVQFLLLGAGCVAALAGLLADRVQPLLLWPCLLALTAAPSVLEQLSTAYADLPLAFFCAAGAVAAARWLVADERWALDVATLFFAAAALTKSEGTLVAVAALVMLAVAAEPPRLPRLRLLAQAAAVVLAAVVPWWIYIARYHVPEDNYSLTDLLRPGYVAGRLDRAWPTLHSFLGELVSLDGWPLLVPLFLVAAAASLAAGRRRLPLFALGLCSLSLLGFVAIYVVSDQRLDLLVSQGVYRLVATVVVCGAALAPLLAAETLRARAGRAR